MFEQSYVMKINVVNALQKYNFINQGELRMDFLEKNSTVYYISFTYHLA